MVESNSWHQSLLYKMPPNTKHCPRLPRRQYIKKLADVDKKVLQELINESYKRTHWSL